uniref:G-protein coupled receptors family 1 profile domain-containing protein n=1 Tax=Pseudonaja textilis TaxID=8673 RepID=A0A670ZI74_PSETE
MNTGTRNSSYVTEFILMGLSHECGIQLFLIALFLIFYRIVLPSNVLIIITIWGGTHLNSPRHFLLANLAFLDIWYSSITAPKMLADFFSERKVISFEGCIAQLFFLHFVGAAEMFLLTVMAYNHYVAICKLCIILVVASWAGGFIHSLIQVVLIICLPFCGLYLLCALVLLWLKLKYSSCDITQVLRITCTDSFMEEMIMIFSSGLISVVCSVALLVSYAFLLTVLKRSMGKSASKALSTCYSHIIIVIFMFGPAIYIYARPFDEYAPDRVVSVFYAIIFPLLNPIIYTLWNKEITTTMKKLVLQYLLCRKCVG